jgi:hypothetical protein
MKRKIILPITTEKLSKTCILSNNELPTLWCVDVLAQVFQFFSHPYPCRAVCRIWSNRKLYSRLQVLEDVDQPLKYLAYQSISHLDVDAKWL